MGKVFVAAAFALISSFAAFAQAERFDKATFVAPTGWKRVEAGGGLSFTTVSKQGGASSCQIAIYPSGPSKGDAKKDFEAAWANIVTAGLRSSAQAIVSRTKRPDGWESVSGAANIAQAGSKYATAVTTVTDLRRSISFQVTVFGTGTDCAPAISAFFNSLKFEPVVRQGNTTSAVSQSALSGETYDFTPPAGWNVRKMEGHMRLESPGGSCIILIFTPQASLGSLDRDAAAIFDNMYKGWQPQKSGEQRFTLSKGVLPSGQEFFVTEAGMKKLSADGTRYDGFEDGLAMAVRDGSNIAVVAARHNTSLLGHSDCYGKYAGWRRFFNSFSIRNAAASSILQKPLAKRIIGRWSMSESGASGEYVFAANGNYALIGALGTTRTSSDINYDYLHITTYAFPGDGSYAILGNELTLRRRGGGAEKVRFRFDEVNHGGGGWTDRIHMLKRDVHGESEVSYERRMK